MPSSLETFFARVGNQREPSLELATSNARAPGRGRGWIGPRLATV